jgi:hypothetical protein
MPAVDLDADLIPNTSAAGFRLGARLPECPGLLREAVEVEYRPGFNLVEAIDRNTGVLVVRNCFPMGSGHTAVFFGAGVVNFGFNAREELFEVSIREGYRGRAFGRIGIGSPLEEVRALFPVFYDGGDEMYYPVQEQSPGVLSGIAFLAGEEELPGGTPVLGISVHDWELMRHPRASG